MKSLDVDAVEELLTARGLAALLPVRLAGRRVGCAVWAGWIRSNHGDAEVQVQVYPLSDEPESIVDLEEEINALQDAHSTRRLVHQARDTDWGILITCAAVDGEVASRAFAAQNRDEHEVAYHPQLDRILGGDFFRQLRGHWVKHCLASVERALTVPDLLEQAEAAYAATGPWPGKLKKPIPQLLSIFELPDVAAIERAPESYRRLAQMVFVIATPEVITIHPPSGTVGREAFTRQLFGFLASEHRAGICCSRDAGCCIRPEFLAADGALTDVYFMWRPADPSMRKRAAEMDVWNALVVICELARGDAIQVARLVGIAAVQYTGRTELPRDEQQLVATAAAGFRVGDAVPLKAVAHAMLRRGEASSTCAHTA